jgi:hypothetical protein
MQLLKLLHKTFEKTVPTIHKTRLKNVLSAVEAVFHSNKLTLTALGRHLSHPIKTRNNIKKRNIGSFSSAFFTI